MYDDKKFHVVFRFEQSISDVVIVGIFSRWQEAEVMVIDLKEAKEDRPCRIEMSLRAIKEFLKMQPGEKYETLLRRMEIARDAIMGMGIDPGRFPENEMKAARA